ncbi:serine hydrolase domain-containing protein [Ancylobacter pratisalsi]|uniref:Beta-lactamase family protein n=1 Tax=Ancylobacter pratisalsi TaxID=1745854 RepID=A0A6P1YP92_9HYPH|nr:serine hydrolase domain-containing protein [Ancylobacter pratisalsi]QIB34551.1 beta-lactamase family protein [Ancylobacter pratisalsi]
MRGSFIKGVIVASALLVQCGRVQAQSPATVPQVDTGAIETLAREHMKKRHLASLLMQVRVNGEEVMTFAAGEAMTGVPATIDGHFRNGAVAMTYVAAISMKLADSGAIDLDEPIARWLPGLPAATSATPRMLLNMTSGYPDYVPNAGFVKAFETNPFRTWSVDDRIAISTAMPRLFAPGTNWDYSHSGYVILGRVLERATGKPMHALMQEYILGPLALAGTHSIETAQVPEPVIHAFTAERGVYEDATYWNPSWTITQGAVQVTTISDMARSFDLIVGDDTFLGAASRAAMIKPSLVGFGSPLPGCRTCHQMTSAFTYGLGFFLENEWVLQTPLFGGYASSVATLPADRSRDGRRITVAVAVTSLPDSYPDWTATLPNWADELTKAIATRLAPDTPPPPFR